MKLRKIEIDGFGKLVNQTYDFGPGLNVIFGHNEAGKSTLQRAIFAALYGFFDDGSITAAKKASMKLYEPWNTNAHYGLKLSFVLDKGTQYLVERMFAPKMETNLYDLKTGKLVNTKFRSASQGRLFFSENLLGMPREVFENTALVHQAELAALENSVSAITDVLLKISASASQESTAGDSLNLLSMALKEKIGSTRSRNKPLPEAQRRLEELQSARSQLKNEYQLLANRMAELAQGEENFRKLQYERDKTEYLLLSAQRLVVQQQHQVIEQADAEVERSQKKVSDYQKWSFLPVDAPSLVQRLVTQYEVAALDVNTAEQNIISIKKRITLLQAQFSELFRQLDNSLEVQECSVADLLAIRETFEIWLEKYTKLAGEIIQENLQALSSQEQKWAKASQVDYEEISKDRQELSRLENELSLAEITVQKLQQSALDANLPEEKWEQILLEAQSEVEKWEMWCDFPIQLRDDLLQALAQYTQINKLLAGYSRYLSDLQAQKAQFQEKINELEVEIGRLEKFRGIPHQEKTHIQEIATQLEIAVKTFSEANQTFVKIDRVYRDELKDFDTERNKIASLEQLGYTGIAERQQSWTTNKQQLASAYSNLAQSQDAWNKVGMTISEFQQLEKTVKEIQSGKRRIPKVRRGCRSFFVRNNKTGDQTPTEFAIYSQIQPIYETLTHNQEEVARCEKVLQLTEDELKKSIGNLVPDVIHESVFSEWIRELQEFHQRSHLIDKRQEGWKLLNSQKEQAQAQLQNILDRLQAELQNLGYGGVTVEDGINQFLKDCEKKEQLIANEETSERLQSQYMAVKHQVDQFQAQQLSLSQAEKKILAILKKAKIDSGAGPLVEVEIVKWFEVGVENHQQWNFSVSRLENIKKAIIELSNKLSVARSNINTKEESLITFRKQMREKYPGLLKNDFGDLDLAQVSRDLKEYNSFRLKIEKTKEHLGQIKLQADSIRRDINDWTQKNTIKEDLVTELLETLNRLGIENDQASLEQALQAFDDAVKGFNDWREAQQSYNAAVQAQSAVKASLSKIQTEMTDIERKMAALGKNHIESESLKPLDKPDVYESKLQHLNNQASQEHDRLTRLQDDVKRESGSLRNLADLDEEIALVSNQLEQLSRFGQALQIAYDELADATREYQKAFAPHLEKSVISSVSYITNNRYQLVSIDPQTLQTSVLAPEKNEFVSVEQLSTGTKDLLYLLLRTAIAQMMSSSAEKLPLLLDDPLVEFDAVRQMAYLDYLKNLSDHTQILLFTKDDRIRDWFHRSDVTEPDGKLIEL